VDNTPRIKDLVRAATGRVPLDAAELLARESRETIAEVLEQMPPRLVRNILEHLPEHLRTMDPMSITSELQIAGSVADLMEPVYGQLPETATVADAIAYLREAKNARQITYLYTTDAAQKLSGLVVIRDLLLATPQQPLTEVMMRDPFAFVADKPVGDAVRAAVYRQYPVYPVVDHGGRIVGAVRGWRLLERQAVEITAQSGQMVGVNKEERVYSSLWDAFRMRHPWLQLNLLTAFVAAFVVASFEDTITQIVALAAFLPVLAGQSGNTGCQALAITLRGMTLGDLDDLPIRRVLRKEAFLGALNGLLVGTVAGVAMWFYAAHTGSADPLRLALVICVAMIGACTGSGIFGVLVPVFLRRYGADPATASSIFLTTFTDILGMGLMLGLATMLIS